MAGGILGLAKSLWSGSAAASPDIKDVEVGGARITLLGREGGRWNLAIDDTPFSFAGVSGSTVNGHRIDLTPDGLLTVNGQALNLKTGERSQQPNSASVAAPTGYAHGDDYEPSDAPSASVHVSGDGVTVIGDVSALDGVRISGEDRSVVATGDLEGVRIVIDE